MGLGVGVSEWFWGALGMSGTLGYLRLYGDYLVALTCIWDPEPSLTPLLPRAGLSILVMCEHH